MIFLIILETDHMLFIAMKTTSLYNVKQVGGGGGRLNVDMVVICGVYKVPVSIYVASEAKITERLFVTAGSIVTARNASLLLVWTQVILTACF